MKYCRPVPKEVCADITENVPREKCVDVPKQTCEQKPKKVSKDVCVNKPEEVCKDVKVAVTTYKKERQCHQVLIKTCKTPM